MNISKIITRLAALIAVGSSITINSHAQSFLTNGLVAYYQFNGNANDSSGNENNGTAYGVAFSDDRFGNTNSACYVSGVNSYVSASASNLPTTNRTVAFWFDAYDVTKGRSLLGYGGGTCGSSFLMNINNPDGGANKFETQGQCRSNRLLTPLGNTVGQWHHWAVTFLGNRITMFLDGIQLGTTNTFSMPTSVVGKNLIIGMAVAPSGTGPYSDSNLAPFIGVIDDVRIYNLALSTNEVQQLYAYESQPVVTLKKAVKPSFSNLYIGTNYQLQVTSDLTTWTNSGSPFTPTNTVMDYPQYWDVDNWNDLFFRLQVSP